MDLCAWFKETAKWTGLRQISKLRVTQLTILMPVLGYLIIFNSTVARFLQLSDDFVWNSHVFAFYRLYFLYFGLTLVGIASLLYQSKCPDLIKAHGSAWEFAAREGATMSRARLVAIQKQVVTWRNIGQMPAGFGVPFQQFLDMTLNSSKYMAWMQTRTTPSQVTEANTFRDHLGKEWKGYDWNDPQIKTDLLTDFYVPQKKLFPGFRYTILSLYIAGFLILAVPTTDVFIRVLISFVRPLF